MERIRSWGLSSEMELSTHTLKEEHKKEVRKLKIIIDDYETVAREQDKVIRQFIAAANVMNPEERIKDSDEAIQHIHFAWKELSAHCKEVFDSLEVMKEKYDHVTKELKTSKAHLHDVNEELVNLQKYQACCYPMIRRKWLQRKKKNTVAPMQGYPGTKCEATINHHEDDYTEDNQTGKHLNKKGPTQEELDLKEDLKLALKKINALCYDLHREREKVQRLREIVEKLQENRHLREGPIRDVKTTADFAVIATVGSITFNELSINDVITFHATSVIDNDFKFKEIGRGAFGRVLLARHTASSDTVAIKGPIIPLCLSPDKFESEKRSHLGQLTKEYAISQFLSRNKHFPKIYGTVVLEDNVCVVQEFIGDKETGKQFPLMNITKSRPNPLLSANTLLGIALDVVEAIDYMHDHGFLHNDIKMDNVLLERRNNHWQAFIIDLGLVSTIAFPPRISINESIIDYHRKRSGNVYIAPEVVDDGTSLSIASDIYSVGVLIVIIGKAARYEQLVDIGRSCSQESPMLRPWSLKDVSQKLLTLREDF